MDQVLGSIPPDASTQEEMEALPEEMIDSLHVFKMGGFFPFTDELGTTANENGCIGLLPWFTHNVTFYLYRDCEEFFIELY